MARDNNHKRTSMVAVREAREGVREQMERALSGTPLPPQRKEEIVTRVGAVVEDYISPYPHPEVLAQIERLAPGSAAMIVQAAVNTVEHQNNIESRELDLKEKELDVVKTITKEDFSSVKQGRILGFVSFLAVLAFSGMMYSIGAEKLSYFAFGASFLGIITQIIRGGPSIKIEQSAASEEPAEPEPDASEAAETRRLPKSKGG